MVAGRLVHLPLLSLLPGTGVLPLSLPTEQSLRGAFLARLLLPINLGRENWQRPGLRLLSLGLAGPLTSIVLLRLLLVWEPVLTISALGPSLVGLTTKC